MAKQKTVTVLIREAGRPKRVHSKVLVSGVERSDIKSHDHLTHRHEIPVRLQGLFDLIVGSLPNVSYTCRDSDNLTEAATSHIDPSIEKRT